MYKYECLFFFFLKMCGHLPNQSAPSVSSCVAAKGDDPVTAASLPTCREPSLSALRKRKKRDEMQLEVGLVHAFQAEQL